MNGSKNKNKFDEINISDCNFLISNYGSDTYETYLPRETVKVQIHVVATIS